MPYEFYKILHILGFIALFSSIGFSAAFYFLSSQKGYSEKRQKNFFLAPLHGISLLIILISGFALTAKLQITSIVFYILKLSIFILFGMLLYLFKKFPKKNNIFLIVAIILGVFAGSIGLLKPF